MESEHRYNCKSDNSRLPTPQFPLLDQLSFNPASQDPSSSSPELFSATPTGRDEVPELTREVFNQDLIMVSYFSGTRHLSQGLLDWMKLYVRLQSWNLGNEDALSPDDIAIIENPSLIPIFATLRKKPRLERDGLTLQPGSVDQMLQPQNCTRAEASTTPLLLSDCYNPPAKLQCVPKTIATLASTDIAATTTKPSYPALIPTSTSLVPLKEMTLGLIMSQPYNENLATNAAGTELEFKTAFTAEQTPESPTKCELEHVPLNQKWKLKKENIVDEADMLIHRLRAIMPNRTETDHIAETEPEPTVKPIPILENVHAQKVSSIIVSESTQKLETTLINDNSNLPKKEATLSIAATTEPYLSAKMIPESKTKFECAPVLQSAKKTKLDSIDTKWKPSKEEMNELYDISEPEFINRLHACKPVTEGKTKPSNECASGETDLKIENASTNIIYKLLKKKVKKAIKRDKASKRRHNKCARRHHAVYSPMEDEITVSEFLSGLNAHISATKPETKPDTKIKCDNVSENTFHLDQTPDDTKQTHWNEEEINKTDKLSAPEFIYKLSAQTSTTENPPIKTEKTPELTNEGVPFSDSVLKIEPAPNDKIRKLSQDDMNKVFNTQNGDVLPSTAKQQPHVSTQRRKKDKTTETEFMNRVIAHMSVTKPETIPESKTKCAYTTENTLQLDTTPIDTKQKHCNEEKINEKEKISPSELTRIYRVSAQTSTTENPATKIKTIPEFTVEGAMVSESSLEIKPAAINTKGNISNEQKVFNTQNGEVPPSTSKQLPRVSAPKRKEDKITETEFIWKLIAHISATKPETKPEPAIICAYVSENALHLDPRLINTKNWSEEKINKKAKISESEFICRLSTQTSTTENPATKTKTTPEFTNESAPVCKSALKIVPGPIDIEEKLSNEHLIHQVFNTQNGEFPSSATKRLHRVSTRKQKKDKITKSEIIDRLIAHMSATKPETEPENTSNCAHVSEKRLHSDPMPIDTKQKLWNENQINKTEQISASQLIYRLITETPTENPVTKTKTTPEFTTEGARVSESELKIQPAPIDAKGSPLWKEEMNKVINTQYGEASPFAPKRRPRVSARRRKKDKSRKLEFTYRLNAHMSTTKVETKPEPTAENNAVLQNVQQLQATPPYENLKLLKKEAISETDLMSTSAYCNGTRANFPAATETKLEREIGGTPVLLSMQNVETSSVKRKRPKKRKRSKRDTSMPEIRDAPASPSPARETYSYSTHFERVRLTYCDYFNFLEHDV